MKLSIIIPVYNEEKRIKKTIMDVLSVKIQGIEKEIIIIDDGSRDNTLKNLRKFFKISNSQVSIFNRTLKFRIKNSNIILCSNKVNKGKGYAVKTGIKYATGDVYLIQDADNEYDTKDYETLLRPFKKHELVVYGSRNKGRKRFKSKHSNFMFYLGGLCLTCWVNVLYGLKLTDQASGYKLFHKVVRDLLLQPKENGFCYETAVTALLAKNDIDIIEIPIHYYPRSMSDGKKIRFSDFVSSIYTSFLYRFFSFKSYA